MIAFDGAWQQRVGQEYRSQFAAARAKKIRQKNTSMLHDWPEDLEKEINNYLGVSAIQESDLANQRYE